MSGLWSLLLPVEANLYAVPMGSVREVARGLRVTVLPTAPPVVLGLFNLRGEVVPLLDTATLVGVGRIPATPFAAVLDTPYGPVGLAASDVPESVVLGGLVGPSEAPGTAGIYAVGSRLVVLIDVDLLISPERVGGQVLASHGVPEA